MPTETLGGQFDVEKKAMNVKVENSYKIERFIIYLFIYL